MEKSRHYCEGIVHQSEEVAVGLSVVLVLSSLDTMLSELLPGDTVSICIFLMALATFIAFYRRQGRIS